MKIQIFGSGCPSCKKLYERVQKVVDDSKIEAEIEYVADVQKMLDLGIIQAPALAIDGRPVSAGFVPTEDQIKNLISKNNRCSCKNC